jgi:hypothetical protein
MSKSKEQTAPVVTIESLLERVASVDKEAADEIKAIFDAKNAEIAALISIEEIDIVETVPIPSLEERTFTVTINKKKIKSALPAVPQFFFGGKKHRTADVIDNSELKELLVVSGFILLEKIK